MTEAIQNASICMGCGLCCDGTLHGHTRVWEADEQAVAAVGLDVVEQDGNRIFRQPCPHFSCGACRVYQDRPPVCARYRCALLKSVDAGQISEEDARERIETALNLVSAVRGAALEAITPADRSQLARELNAKLANLAGDERSRTARLLLDLAALDYFLTQWFRVRRQLDESRQSDAQPVFGQE
jgi:uncharacterized protein